MSVAYSKLTSELIYVNIMAKAFGTEFMPEMIISRYADKHWSNPEFVPSDSLNLHPGSHVLHYASTCFEGLKAFRHEDGTVNIFRMDQNVKRFEQSSRLLALPPVDEQMVSQMIIDVVAKFKDHVPSIPGSMYIRPTHIGTEAAIGKAAAPSDESLLYVLLSPVGEYFSSDVTLRLELDDVGMRCAPDNGMIKSGGNYASALKHLIRAKAAHNADQVLFCSDGGVTETGAANFILIDSDEIITKALDESFLHGVTRSSILTLAREFGYSVIERDLTAEELVDRATHPDCEAALSGTAAVLAPVGTLIFHDKEYMVGTGNVGPKVSQLKQALNQIQWGQVKDSHGWLTRV